MIRKTFFITIILALAACSNQQVYDSIQVNRQNECLKLDIPQREACFERYGMSYKEYERLREDM